MADCLVSVQGHRATFCGALGSLRWAKQRILVQGFRRGKESLEEASDGTKRADRRGDVWNGYGTRDGEFEPLVFGGPTPRDFVNGEIVCFASGLFFWEGSLKILGIWGYLPNTSAIRRS